MGEFKVTYIDSDTGNELTNSYERYDIAYSVVNGYRANGIVAWHNETTNHVVETDNLIAKMYADELIAYERAIELNEAGYSCNPVMPTV